MVKKLSFNIFKYVLAFPWHMADKAADKQKRIFSVKFILGESIQTQIQSQNVKPLEAIALLEMAKDQMMANMRKTTKHLFGAQKKD